MCDLATALMVTQVVGAAASYVGGKKNAEAQIDMTNDLAQAQQSQINAEASSEQLKRSREAARERATMKVAQGESGLAGITPGLLLMDSMFQEGFDNSVTDYNRQTRINASQSEARSRNARASAQAPTLFETGLQIAGAVSNYGVTQERAGKKPFWSS